MALEVTNVQPPLVEKIYKDSSKAHPIHYTTTLYNQDGSLIVTDDDLLKQEQDYFTQFIDPKQAQELRRRLAILDSPDYVPGSEQWVSMEVTDNNDEDDSEGTEGES